MNQTLKKIKNLVAFGKDPSPASPGFSKLFKLEPVVSQQTIPNNKIAERAFMIWQDRGCRHGNDREDWLLAKIQLEDELN